VNQALQVLSREGLLQIEYGSIRIRDLARLRRYAARAPERARVFAFDAWFWELRATW